MRYAVVIERSGDNFSAYVPDLSGCIAPGPTPEFVESEIREAIRFHVAGLRADSKPVPASADPFAAPSEWGRAIDDEDYGDL